MFILNRNDIDIAVYFTINACQYIQWNALTIIQGQLEVIIKHSTECQMTNQNPIF